MPKFQTGALDRGNFEILPLGNRLRIWLRCLLRRHDAFGSPVNVEGRRPTVKHVRHCSATRRCGIPRLTAERGGKSHRMFTGLACRLDTWSRGDGGRRDSHGWSRVGAGRGGRPATRFT
jgi:hypothetical protein